MAEQVNEATPARTFLQPIAAPSILGLYAFAGSTFIVAAHLAGWYGSGQPQTTWYLFPFAAMFGGLAQFTAGVWAYKARDAIATAMHGMWGAFWLGFGILNLLLAAGILQDTRLFHVSFGYWFIALGFITLMGAIAATAENLALASVLHTLWLASGLLAIAEMLPSESWRIASGWVFLLSAVLAWYTASALMFEGVFGRAVLPVGMTKKAQQESEVNIGAGEPGVAKGQ
jgi:succinate-acetate transporter protein